jgi:hypothetical protein
MHLEPALIKRQYSRKYAATTTQKLVLSSWALLLASLGLVASRVIPGLLGYACLLLPILGLVGLVGALYDQLILTEQTLTYRALGQSWQIALAEINSWRFAPFCNKASLELRTTSGQTYHVPYLKSLGVGNPNHFAQILASAIRLAQANSASQTLPSLPSAFDTSELPQVRPPSPDVNPELEHSPITQPASTGWQGFYRMPRV